MNLPFFIAKRYFLSRKRLNYVHLLSLVSQFGIAIGTASLVIVLSVFNGFENLVIGMYNVFDPHLKITTTEGKNFNQKECLEILANQDGIDVLSCVLEEKVLAEYNSKQYIATIKGVDHNYNRLTNFDSVIVNGENISNYNHDNVGVVGRGIVYYLSMNIGTVFDQVNVYLPNREANNLLNLDRAFKKSSLTPVGVFGVQQEIDSEYIITPIGFVQDLINKENVVSAIEIKLSDSKEMLSIQKILADRIGEKYIIQNRFEQQDFLYKILNTEKLAVFLILLFIIIIAAFNIISSLTILIIDKKNDISSLFNLGLDSKSIKNIFLYKSMFGVLTGSFLGIVFGAFLSFLQQQFGLIKMGEGSFVIDYYPVIIRFKDLIVVQLLVLMIGFCASWITSLVMFNKKAVD
jgi:lipoprotein-releasing system permease protein